MPTDLHDTHPRPLLARTTWTDLSGEWQFAYDDNDDGLSDHWEHTDRAFTDTIQVPFPPESPASGVGDTQFHRILWYRLAFDQAPLSPGRRLLLHFGAVDYTCDVWVNGSHAAAHAGGQTAFDIDITDQLVSGGSQVITLRVVDDPEDLEQPRGKQDWQLSPHTIWYDRTSGIWQPVWTEEVSAVHITSLDLDTDSNNTVHYRVRLSASPDDGAQIRLRISYQQLQLGEICVTVTGRFCSGAIRLDHPTLEVEPALWQWSPENPVLLDAAAILQTPGGVDTDEVHSYLGLRTVATDDRSFLLNGRPYYLRLALHQGFWPETHLASPQGPALREEVQWVKRLGFNGVRTHQKVEDPRFLYWCDKLGVLVMADAAAAYTYSDRSLQRTINEWTRIITQNRGHPSIIAWVAFNESWGVPNLATDPSQRQAVRAAYHLLKALDPSRPVIGNDGWEFVTGDFIGIHDYTNQPSQLIDRYANRGVAQETVRTGRPGGRRLIVTDDAIEHPILLSEFGGATLSVNDGQVWSGYDTRYSAQDLVTSLENLFGAVHALTGIAGFCYTQLADTQQEKNGLLTAERLPKADPDHLAAIIRGELSTTQVAKEENKEVIVMGNS